jgi:hypothetical protein
MSETTGVVNVKQTKAGRNNHQADMMAVCELARYELSLTE